MKLIRVRGCVAAAGVVLILAGCSAIEPAPVSTREPTVEPTEPVQAASAPVPLVALECDELVPQSIIDAALGTSVDTRSFPVSGLTDQSLLSQSIYDAALRQNGGMACLWASGDTVDQSETFRGLSIRVLPNAAASWSAAYPHMTARADDSSALGDASIVDCGYDVYYGDCFYDVLVGDYWVQAEVKVNDYDGAHDSGAIVSAAVDAVAALPAPGVAWEPAATSTPSSCVGIVDLADLRAKLGAPELAERFDFAALFTLDWGVNESALAQAHGLHCRWVSPDEGADQSTFDLVVLPAAAWAWDGSAAPAPNPYDVPLSAIADVGDAAWGGCEPDYLRCTLHVSHDSSWYVLSAFGPGATLPALVTLANAVLD